MGYMHYGNIGDIWKHFPLCAFLANERPRFYIETNSAEACHDLEHTPGRDYGIFTVARKIEEHAALRDSAFYSVFLECNENVNEPGMYPGSPGLAMDILGNGSERYIFCDTDGGALDSVRACAEKKGLSDRTGTFRGDSVKTFYGLADDFTPDDFIHIDPYLIFEENAEGKTYFDVFLESARRGLKTMLWYGYDTASQKRDMNARMKREVRRAGIKGMVSVELFLSVIRENEVPVNPGVLGCGVAVANLSGKSTDDLESLADELVRLYEDTTLHDGKISGRLLKDGFSL